VKRLIRIVISRLVFHFTFAQFISAHRWIAVNGRFTPWSCLLGDTCIEKLGTRARDELLDFRLNNFTSPSPATRTRSGPRRASRCDTGDDVLVGRLLVELELGGIPLERGLREPRGDAAHKHRFRSVRSNRNWRTYARPGRRPQTPPMVTGGDFWQGKGL